MGQQAYQDNARIPCPRCRANNFLGQSQCWQCHSPLPPPEAVQRPVMPMAAPIQPTYAFHTAARPRNRLPLVVVGLAVLCGGLAFVVLRMPKAGESGETLGRARRQPGTAQPETGDPQTIWVTGPASDNPIASESDPVAAEARRAVERASRELDLPPANAARDSEGRYRLRGGGSISAEEWERARRKVRDNSMIKEPPLPPPF
jgi:hypothetical protein